MQYLSQKSRGKHVEIDGNLITGQNQNSALKIAEAVIEKLGF